MIDYKPDRWQLRFIWRIRGSVLPKAFAWAVPSTVLSIVLHMFVMTRNTDMDTRIFSTFNFALSFTIVFRSQQAYSRYWEAISILQRVKGYWFEAAGACFAFCDKSHANQAKVGIFKHSMIRMLSMLYCTSLQQICNCKREDFEIIEISGFDQESVELLSESPERSWVVMLWMQQLILENADNGTLHVPAPILSRVFQELSNGMVAIADAQKITDIPFPFPLAQMVSLLLILMTFLTPAVLATTVESLSWCAFLNFCSILVLYCIHYIAAEIEMPFGDDANDLPVAALQESLNTSLIQLLNERLTECPKYSLNQDSCECRTVCCDFHSGEQFQMISSGGSHQDARAKARRASQRSHTAIHLDFDRDEKDGSLEKSSQKVLTSIAPKVNVSIEEGPTVLKEQDPIKTQLSPQMGDDIELHLSVLDDVAASLAELSTKIKKLYCQASSPAELPSKMPRHEEIKPLLQQPSYLASVIRRSERTAEFGRGAGKSSSRPRPIEGFSSATTLQSQVIGASAGRAASSPTR
eukprot:TRINITY_DN67712_c0_g1_i1.p1 TRINITY_DN67712_c0_g1~~TRINITY_DN67712_c0_g1_i1.p1  ORF type:complete len:524 (+),score=66.32 TRINITY_DN67712_c0_g1_i1:62-1633(+)